MNRSIRILWFILIARQILCLYNCNNDEFYAKKSCYKLLNLQDVLGTELHYIEQCQRTFYENLKTNKHGVIDCLNHLNSALKNIAKILINNLKLNDHYEFGILNTNDKNDQVIFKYLIEKYSKHSSSKRLKIFMSSFFYNHNIYIKSQPNEGEFPNVMLHDEDLNSDLLEKCIYVKISLI